MTRPTYEVTRQDLIEAMKGWVESKMTESDAAEWAEENGYTGVYQYCCGCADTLIKNLPSDCEISVDPEPRES